MCLHVLVIFYSTYLNYFQIKAWLLALYAKNQANEIIVL